MSAELPIFIAINGYGFIGIGFEGEFYREGYFTAIEVNLAVKRNFKLCASLNARDWINWFNRCGKGLGSCLWNTAIGKLRCQCFIPAKLETFVDWFGRWGFGYGCNIFAFIGDRLNFSIENSRFIGAVRKFVRCNFWIGKATVQITFRQDF